MMLKSDFKQQPQQLGEKRGQAQRTARTLCQMLPRSYKLYFLRYLFIYLLWYIADRDLIYVTKCVLISNTKLF